MEKQLTTEEGNKIIAEFMDAKYCPYPDGHFPGEYGWRFSDPMPCNVEPRPNTEGYWWNENSLSFHTSWDWLMPCYKQFNQLVFNGDIQHDMESSAVHDALEVEILKVNIVNAHKYLVQLIEWYNLQSK